MQEHIGVKQDALKNKKEERITISDIHLMSFGDPILARNYKENPQNSTKIYKK